MKKDISKHWDGKIVGYIHILIDGVIRDTLDIIQKATCASADPDYFAAFPGVLNFNLAGTPYLEWFFKIRTNSVETWSWVASDAWIVVDPEGNYPGDEGTGGATVTVQCTPGAVASGTLKIYLDGVLHTTIPVNRIP